VENSRQDAHCEHNDSFVTAIGIMPTSIMKLAPALRNRASAGPSHNMAALRFGHPEGGIFVQFRAQ
jgi:hypothetical protein